MNISIFLFCLHAALSLAGELSAKDIMAKSEEARKIPDMQTSCRLVQANAGEAEKLKQFRWWRKLADNGIDYHTMVRFFEPATVKGEGILILEKDHGENEVLLYLPAFKKIRRVENQQQTGKFMGSEFSYSDMATPHLADYIYISKGKVSCPIFPKISCYIIESTPANEATKERTGYSRIKNWIREDNFMAEQVEFYDGEGKLFKTLSSNSIEPAADTPGKWISMRSQMLNHRTNSLSKIEFLDVQTGKPIATNIFTQQNLSRTD